MIALEKPKFQYISIANLYTLVCEKFEKNCDSFKLSISLLHIDNIVNFVL